MLIYKIKKQMYLEKYENLFPKQKMYKKKSSFNPYLQKKYYPSRLA